MATGAGDEPFETARQRGLLEDDDEDLAVVPLGTVEAAHAVPGVATAPEDQAVVVEALRRLDRVEVLEVRARVRVEAAAVVEQITAEAAKKMLGLRIWRP